jgi:hypothetical protein
VKNPHTVNHSHLKQIAAHVLKLKLKQKNQKNAVDVMLKKEASASGPAGSAVGCAAYNLQCLSKCKAEKDATACEANCGKLMDLCKQNGGK